MSNIEEAQATPLTGERTTKGVTDVGPPDSDDTPYPGLRSFRRDETHIFFGREGTINEMVDRLAAHRFLAVTGASGSGKSSLVRTGLLDALDRGLLAEAGPDWCIADFRPGDRPLARLSQALAQALGRNFTPDEIAIIDARLARGPQGLVDWLEEIKFPPHQNILLLADQFEEIFRYRRGNTSDEIEFFVALLLFSAARRKQRIFVVITMRSDFLGECARFTGLAEAINDGQFLTPRLSRAQCQEAIEGPALVYGGRVEKALVTRLLNDLGSNPDELPLMQHILMLMWRKAEGKADGREIVLTLAAYEELGGVGPGPGTKPATLRLPLHPTWREETARSPIMPIEFCRRSPLSSRGLPIFCFARWSRPRETSAVTFADRLRSSRSLWSRRSTRRSSIPSSRRFARRGGIFSLRPDRPL